MRTGPGNKELGTLGEEIAIKMLKEKGLAVLEQNFRCRHGEIDIIARDRDKVVFIEVKTRKSGRFGAPEEAVGWRKQKRLRLLAACYLAGHFTGTQFCRFDVYSICLDKDNQVQSVQVFEDCF